MSPELFRKLAALGLDNDQIAGVLEIMDADAEGRKEKGRQRWRKWKDAQGANVSKRLPTTTNVSIQLASAEGSSSKEDITNKEDRASPSAQSKRASRLPADWALPEEWLQEAIAAGLSRQRALSEAERMKNWSLSNKNGAKLDWLAAWRNWYRDKAEPLLASARPPDRPPRNAGEAARLDLQRSENDDAPSPQIRHDDQSDGGPGFAGTGIARRIAIATSR